MRAILGHQTWGHCSRRSMSLDCGNLGWKCCHLVLHMHVLVLLAQRNLQNVVVCEERFGKNPASYVHLTYRSFSERVSPRISFSFSRQSKQAMDEFKLRKHWEETMASDKF